MKEILIKYLGKAEAEALIRYNNGEDYHTSTFIDEDTIIAGYGGLDGLDFKYPLPFFLIKMIYGTLSWSEYLNKRN